MMNINRTHLIPVQAGNDKIKAGNDKIKAGNDKIKAGNDKIKGVNNKFNDKNDTNKALQPKAKAQFNFGFKKLSHVLNIGLILTANSFIGTVFAEKPTAFKVIPKSLPSEPTLLAPVIVRACDAKSTEVNFPYGVQYNAFAPKKGCNDHVVLEDSHSFLIYIHTDSPKERGTAFYTNKYEGFYELKNSRA